MGRYPCFRAPHRVFDQSCGVPGGRAEHLTYAPKKRRCGLLPQFGPEVLSLG